MSALLQGTTLNHKDAHVISVGILEFLDNNEIEPQLGLAALMMTVGRLCAPRVLTPLEEVAFVQQLSEWQAMYFMEGEVH